MDIALYQQFFEIEDTYWWSRWVRDMALDQVPPAKPLRILDLGCGTGAFSKALRQRGRVVSFDFMPDALAYCRRRGLSALVQGDAQRLPFRDHSFDCVVAIDTLEHLREDGAALAETRRVLAPQGLLIVNVPALPLLWSHHDVVNHHFRRYRKGELRDRIEAAGFRLERLTYTNFVLFPPTLVSRLGARLIARRQETADLPHLPGWLNTCLYGIISVERRLVRYVNLPVGTSVFAVARPA